MRIKGVQVENFRLLRDVAVGLEDRTTLIVGRNSSGKTSIAELFRRLLGDKVPPFRVEDFSLIATNASGQRLKRLTWGGGCA